MWVLWISTPSFSSDFYPKEHNVHRNGYALSHHPSDLWNCLFSAFSSWKTGRECMHVCVCFAILHEDTLDWTCKKWTGTLNNHFSMHSKHLRCMEGELISPLPLCSAHLGLCDSTHIVSQYTHHAWSMWGGERAVFVLGSVFASEYSYCLTIYQVLNWLSFRMRPGLCSCVVSPRSQA